MKALVIDGNCKSADAIAGSLSEIGLACDIASTGRSGLKKLLSGDYRLLILEVDLPDFSGIELVRRARDFGDLTPIIILSARNQVGDRVCGLNIGADDYLAKPFSSSELKARANALLRRSGMEHRRNRMSYRDLELNVLEHKAFRRHRALALTPREFDMLEYMVRNANRTVSVGMILQDVWRCSADPSSTMVETRICHLRKKLCADGEDDLIHTVRGFGYVLR